MSGIVMTRTGAGLRALGQGTWMMGADGRRRNEEIAALRLGLDLGLDLIDTAEMYADGAAEELVAEAIEGRREEVFIVSKVLPGNASRHGTMEAAERSLRRLRTDRIDLYLLHWEGPHPMAETLEAFDRLRTAGMILHYGVSNIDIAEMAAAETLPHGKGIAANQILYNLERRGAERRLIPWCVERGITVMAYSPLEHGSLRTRKLAGIAARHGVTPESIAIAWLLQQEGVMTIPKATTEAHVRANAAARDVVLTAEDLAEIDAAYPPPDRDIPLETA